MYDNYIQLNPHRNYLELGIINDVLKHLKTEKDENLALRTALLVAVRLLQQEDDFPAQDFCEGMLTNFPPLTDKFDEHNQHPFYGDKKLVRVKNADNKIRLVMST